MPDPTGSNPASVARPKVISAQGRAASMRSALIRLGQAVAMLAMIVSVGIILGCYYQGEAIPVAAWISAGGCAIVASALALTDVTYSGVAARREEARIRLRLVERIFSSANLPKHADSQFNSAKLLGLMTDNAEQAAEFRPGFFGTMIAALVIPLMTLLYLLIGVDWVIGVVLVVAFPLIPVLIFGFMKFFRSTSAKSRRERAKLSAQYLDAIRNLIAIRLCGAGKRIQSQLEAQGERNRWAIMKLLAGNQVVIILVDGLFSLLLITAAALVAVIRFQAGAIDFTDAITAVLLSVLLTEPLAMAAGFFYVGMGGRASITAIGDYLQSCAEAERPHTDPALPSLTATTHSTKVAETPESLPVDDVEPPLEAALGSVQLREVSYDYGRGRVLRDINLSIAPGERVAIVGKSGSGKSTLASLIRGSLPVQAGTVMVNGYDVSKLSAKQRRVQTASVSQSTWLLTGTIADNLRLARPEASDDDLWRALEEAFIADDVRAMPEGLDSAAGESGMMISGGQAQRISLARAFLSRRRIVVLDEPTSQVDLESEEKIIEAIARIGADTTVIIITHRHSLLALANRVLVMDEGSLSEVDRTAVIRDAYAQGRVFAETEEK